MRQGRGKKHQLMGFFKKVKQKINGMWYPQSITVGKPVTTDEVAKRLAIESTVSPADTFAVLKSLGSVLGSYMADGRTVKLDGVGTFYYTAVASGNGVDSPDKVTAKQITGSVSASSLKRAVHPTTRLPPVPSSIPISSGKNGAENPQLPAKVVVVVKGEERLPIRQHKAGCFSGAIKRTGSCTAKGLFCIAKGSFRHCRTTL